MTVSTTARSIRSRFLWLLSEGFVVFVGVAGALAGQAWFEERADRAVERELLENVLIEARASADLLGDQSLEPRVAELTDYARLLGTDNPDDFVVIAERAPTLLNSYGGALASAALDEALQAGNLRLIRDATIRSELDEYQEMVRRVFERFDDHQDWTNGPVRSFLIARGISRRPNVDLPELTRAELLERGAALAASPEFESLVRDQLFLHDELIETTAFARSSLEQIVADLEQVLEAL